MVHLETLIDSLVESVLVFNDIVLSDDDTYHCQATNPGAHDRIFNVFSQSVRLTVHCKYIVRLLDCRFINNVEYLLLTIVYLIYSNPSFSLSLSLFSLLSLSQILLM